jgi:hypothetical protein
VPAPLCNCLSLGPAGLLDFALASVPSGKPLFQRCKTPVSQIGAGVEENVEIWESLSLRKSDFMWQRPKSQGNAKSQGNQKRGDFSRISVLGQQNNKKGHHRKTLCSVPKGKSYWMVDTGCCVKVITDQSRVEQRSSRARRAEQGSSRARRATQGLAKCNG